MHCIQNEGEKSLRAPKTSVRSALGFNEIGPDNRINNYNALTESEPPLRDLEPLYLNFWLFYFYFMVPDQRVDIILFKAALERPFEQSHSRLKCEKKSSGLKNYANILKPNHKRAPNI